MTYQVGWFSTGRDDAAITLLDEVQKAIKDKTIDAEIYFVFSDREHGEDKQSDKFFDKVEEYGVHLECFSSDNFQSDLRKEGWEEYRKKKNWNVPSMVLWRDNYHKVVESKIKGYLDNADINVLAGYMLWVSDELCNNENMINLHPALPDGPKGTWQQVIWKLIKEEAKETGSMMHLVTPDLDRGTPITYCRVPIRGTNFDFRWNKMGAKLKRQRLSEIIENEGEDEPLFKAIRDRQFLTEIPLLIHTIGEFANGNVKIEDYGPERSVFTKIRSGHDITSLVNDHLKQHQ